MATKAEVRPVPAGEWVEIDHPASDRVSGKRVLVQARTGDLRIGGPDISVDDGFRIAAGGIIEHDFYGGGATRDRLFVASESGTDLECYWTGV